MYGYTVNVRQGRPGFADDDEYTQSGFHTFMGAVQSFIHFNPESYWPYLRRVQQRYIYKQTDKKTQFHATIESSNGFIHFFFDDAIVWETEKKLLENIYIPSPT